MALYKHYIVKTETDPTTQAIGSESTPVFVANTELIDLSECDVPCPDPKQTIRKKASNSAVRKPMFSPKVRVVCPHCRKSLTADATTSGASAACPSCGGMMEVPFGGVGLGYYWLMRLIVWGVLVLISVSKFGDAAEIAFLFSLTIATPIRIYYTIQRSINIGNPWYWGFLGLIPFSVFYFGFTREGAAKRKRSRRPKGRVAKALPPQTH